MKRFAFLIFGICWMAISSCSTTSPGVKKEADVAKETALKTAIEQHRFVIQVNRMNPMSGASKQLTSPYSLEIRGDTVVSYLPYFGRAYSVPYGGGNGLNFTSTITDYTSVIDKKGKTSINFKTKTDEDRFSYRVLIFQDGTSTIYVTTENRQPISFDGNVETKN